LKKSKTMVSAGDSAAPDAPSRTRSRRQSTESAHTPSLSKRTKAPEAGKTQAHQVRRGKRGQGRERILAAALELFASQGFDAVSTTDIAEKAGSSQSVVLYHFKTKQELWRAAMRNLFESVSIRPTLEGSMYKDLDSSSKLRVLLRGFVLASARHPELGRVINREGASNNERMQWLFEELAKPTYDVFGALFAEGAAQGVLKKYPPAMLTLVAHGAAACIFNLSSITTMLLGTDPFQRDIVELQADIIVDVLLNGLLQSGTVPLRAADEHSSR
jgi:TetR/AcrR family transcriptional regulator